MGEQGASDRRVLHRMQNSVRISPIWAFPIEHDKFLLVMVRITWIVTRKILTPYPLRNLNQKQQLHGWQSTEAEEIIGRGRRESARRLFLPIILFSCTADGLISSGKR